jgi:AraC-like DNA-binding protein
MLLVNPHHNAFWDSHVVLNGRARDYYVGDFPGPLSIKSVVSGRAVWETSEGRFEIGPGSCLVVNDGQPYSITIESREVVETLCIFFARGFVEDVARTAAVSDDELLADPLKQQTIEFHERVCLNGRVLAPLLERARSGIDETVVWQIAEALVNAHAETRAQAAKLPAAKPSTREELWQRLQRGRNVIEGSLSEAIDLHQVAREAALSPYHFHRSFTRLFGETPHAYLARRRMERAADLLCSTDMPVTEVCCACGYESLGSFSTLFRKHAGVSPLQFRKSRK